MKFKILEVRDEATHVPVMAIKMLAEDAVQSWYVHERCGYPGDGSAIVVMELNRQVAHVDPYDWPNRRTMGHAHHWIYEHFDELVDGQVVDVRVILGEAAEPVKSDRFYTPGD